MIMDRYTCSAVILLLVSSICTTLGQTCAGKCGTRFDSCSCHPTCVSLGSCCTDYKDHCVNTLPYSGSIFGGTDFAVLDTSFNESSQIVCRFNDNINTVGYVDEDNRGHCISPLLYETGWVPFQISSDNGTTFNRNGAWLSVHTGKLNAKFKAVLVNSTKWQYYGTPNVGGSLDMTWTPNQVRAERVNIEVWGYSETGVPYSQNWLAKWEYLYSLHRDHPNNGTFTFVPIPAEKDFSTWELGALRISPSSYPDGICNVHAVWSEDHALAWHLEERFRQDSATWALDKCLAWDEQERLHLPYFLNETIDCPCTLAQARADTGRFHTDYGCDIEKGSVCTYHPGCVHCVRAIQASPKYAAGQQCCYDSTGAQVLTADSIGGSTPDRAHDWGSPPFKKPPRIPGESHWVYDVLSFYYCCLWSDNCHFYFTHRPSSDCRTYLPPKLGMVFGDPHFITFDGVRYSFNGKGEYSLVISDSKKLTVQGRTEPVTLMNGTMVKATKMSAVAMHEGSSDVIEVRVDSRKPNLEVLQNQKSLSFAEQSWMDLKGVFVFSPSPTNVTVMFPTGAGIEVRLREGTMTTTVLLPEEFSGSTRGLLGNLNGDTGDDLTTSDGTVVSNQNNEDVFLFGGSWAISNESSLFTYDSEYLLNTYLYTPKHDPSFVPVYSVPDNPDDPLVDQTSEICSGEGSAYCRYDILVGRSPQLGNATMVSFKSHMSLVDDLAPVVSCGWLSPPKNGMKEGTTYLKGAVVKLSCNAGYTLIGSEERTCQENGQWSGETTDCVADNLTGIVVGSVIGSLALITMAVTITLHSKKQKQKRKIAQSEEDEEATVAF